MSTCGPDCKCGQHTEVDIVSHGGKMNDTGTAVAQPDITRTKPVFMNRHEYRKMKALARRKKDK